MVKYDLIQAIRERLASDEPVLDFRDCHFTVGDEKDRGSCVELDLEELRGLSLHGCTLHLNTDLVIKGSRERFPDTSEAVRSSPDLYLTEVDEVNPRGNGIRLERNFSTVDVTSCLIHQLDLNTQGIGDDFYAHLVIFENTDFVALTIHGGQTADCKLRNGLAIARQLQWNGGECGIVTWFVEPFEMDVFPEGGGIPLPPRILDGVYVSDPHWFRYFRGLCPTKPVQFCGRVDRL